MEKKTLIDSALTNSDGDFTFDIRNYMNYDIIKRFLMGNPTEMALLEITCIMINNNIKEKYVIQENEGPK